MSDNVVSLKDIKNIRDLKQSLTQTTKPEWSRTVISSLLILDNESKSLMEKVIYEHMGEGEFTWFYEQAQFLFDVLLIEYQYSEEDRKAGLANSFLSPVKTEPFYQSDLNSDNIPQSLYVKHVIFTLGTHQQMSVETIVQLINGMSPDRLTTFSYSIGILAVNAIKRINE